MLYQIENKYYIRVAPMRYTEVKLSLTNDDVTIKPTRNKIESSGNTVIKEINFQKEKEKIKLDLLKKEKTDGSENITNGTTKYRKHR